LRGIGAFPIPTIPLKLQRSLQPRAIRCARVKEKVSGCFRTKSGADDFARVLSFISSAALHGVSSFDAIVAAFRGMAVGVLFGVD